LRGRFAGAFATALAALVLAAAPSRGAGSAETLVSLNEAAGAIDGAGTITLSAYTLSLRGRIARALIGAARRGAHVHVLLDGHGGGTSQRENEATAAALTAAGIRTDRTRYDLHMKALVADGAVYVSDRNWSSSPRSLILRLPPSYAIAVERAMLGQTAVNGAFSTRKGDSLQLEAALLARPHSGDVYLETESFGPSRVADAVLSRARAGDRVTIVIARFEYGRSAHERALVGELLAAGVRVFAGTSDEKIAVTGSRAFLGSSNATAGVANQVDWGFVTDEPQIVAALRAHVESNANAATELHR
jgi:phosphatidylserine/phosphatidylglycerophosphate/cardiolipin synthase-like enzyme